MRKLVVISICLLTIFCSLTILNGPYGLESVEPIGPFMNNVFPKENPHKSDWKVVDAFPGHTFIDPVAIVDVPNFDGYYVVAINGVIWFMGDDNTKEVALDITEDVIVSGDDGLTNIILHPEFGVEGSPHQGELFVFYAYHPTVNESLDYRMNILSRFKTFENSTTIDPTSEEILIRDVDPQAYHMGGGMFFDEQGFLYISWGDGGGGNDEYNSSQQITDRFWGGIIRIDVDNRPDLSHPIPKQITEYPGKPTDFPSTITQGYSIPNDNPWVGEEGVLEEFFALGFRSPHRIAQDRVTGKIWVGDVGQGSKEEITIIEKGGNAQWPYMEGDVAGVKDRPTEIIGVENPPIHAYSRSTGISVIGGFVYRGDKWVSELEGQYIFGDYGSGNIWKLDPSTGDVEYMLSLTDWGESRAEGLTSFGYSAEGDVFLLKLKNKGVNSGIVYKLEKQNTTPPYIPELLSETGAFVDLESMKPSSGFIPYRVNSPLWSDYAVKDRWAAFPNDGQFDSSDEQIHFFENGDWIFPKGTVFIKHFEVPIDHRDSSITRKIETRFYVIDELGQGYGLSYRWNEEQSDATLIRNSEVRTFDVIDEFGEAYAQNWEFPGPLQCNTCHNGNAGFVLGVNTQQLNGNLLYPSTSISANQLATWNHVNIFNEQLEEDRISEMPRAVSLSDPNASLRSKVTSYLDSNCASCHMPKGVEGAFDARLTTPLNSKSLINAFGISHTSASGSMIVKAGSAHESLLWQRDISTDTDKMPPLGRNIVDYEWVDLLAEWINGLEEPCYGEFVSNFTWEQWAVNGWGPVEVDRSNNTDLADDGNIMSIAGTTYEKGLGVHAYSEVKYKLNGDFKRFTAVIGVDDESCDQASVVFRVILDNKTIYTSELKRKGEEGEFVVLDISGGNEIKLQVLDGDGSQTCDHANWADARFHRKLDSDFDGVCDDYDACPGVDDHIDVNQDGIPDGCEQVVLGGELEIEVFPNPFIRDFQFNIKSINDLTLRTSVFIYDVSGQLVYENHNVTLGETVNVQLAVGEGTYFLVAKSGAFKGTKNLVSIVE